MGAGEGLAQAKLRLVSIRHAEPAEYRAVFTYEIGLGVFFG